MNYDHFDAGIRHLEIAFSETMDSKRRAVYFQHLCSIPNDMWDSGILRLADQVRFPRLPLIAEIGEACVPGEAERKETDPWSGRWTEVQTPWTARLAKLSQLALSPITLPLQIPGPCDPLSGEERKLLAGPDFAGLLKSVEEKIRLSKERRVAARKADMGGSPYQTIKNVKNLLNVNTEESQAVTEYWTLERAEARKEFLHRQLAWLGRRDAAEREGWEFSEPHLQMEIAL